MNNSRLYILLTMVLLYVVMSYKGGARVVAQDVATIDSIAVGLDSVARDDSVARTDSAQAPKSRFIMDRVDLDNVVNFNAKDSIVVYGKNRAHMYGGSKLLYGEIDLSASQIQMVMDSSQVKAMGVLDSVGELVEKPVFKDSSGDYESREMYYNFKTKRGYIVDVITEQGEGFLTGGVAKKMENDEFYMKNGRYTTCDNHEHPHFYFQLTKGKVKPKKNVVTGPVYMVLEDLPLPLALPFGYFPFTEKFSSGILVPTFGEDYNRGFYLRNGGYYMALNKYIDLALTGEIYTRGSWGISAQSNYTKRYKFNGNFSLNFITTITGDKGDPDYNKMKNFQVLWSHSQNPKANPNMSFSASVNFATSGYSRNNLDTYYSPALTENTKSSSINLTYKLSSKWSLSTTANISQRTADSTLSVSFPNVSITMSQLAPFKRKRVVGEERWYEKIKVSYSGRFQNSLNAKQNEFFHKSLIKDWRNGMSHSVPVSATFNLFKYINVTPNLSMNDRMYTSKIRRQWDPNASREVCDTTYNFYNVFDFNFGVSLNTKIYGFFKPMKFLGDKLQMVRHVMTPTVSFSAAPDFSSPFWGYYGSYDYPDAKGEMQRRKYSYFSHGLFGTAGSGKSGTLSFSIANNIEAKIKSDQDSTGYKKLSIIENFTLSQSYNMAADSLKWSNLNTSILLRLTRGFNLNLSATWDVYKYGLNEAGNPVRINKLRLFNGGGWGRLSSTGTSFSYTINNQTFKRKDKTPKDKASTDATKTQSTENSTSTSDTTDAPSDVTLDSDGYAKWEFPWSVSLNYSVSYGYGTFNKEKMEYNGKFTHSLSLSGNVSPTKNWSASFSASFDVEKLKLNYMNCSISRKMHCFTMSASFVPVGPYKSYNFHIAVNSSILQDVKYDKHSSYSNGITWF